MEFLVFKDGIDAQMPCVYVVACGDHFHPHGMPTHWRVIDLLRPGPPMPVCSIHLPPKQASKFIRKPFTASANGIQIIKIDLD